MKVSIETCLHQRFIIDLVDAVDTKNQRVAIRIDHIQ
ncbi:hypothetical protein KR49_14000 [Synechococcus sp. KORDI-49]|nr:hypothetical protein KR49_14000 [Synechococcus sp. KORDI-49]